MRSRALSAPKRTQIAQAAASLIGDHSHVALVEALIAGAGIFRYADDSDALFGVAPWRPALYFAFGVVVALLGEIAAKDREPSVVAA